MNAEIIKTNDQIDDQLHQ